MLTSARAILVGLLPICLCVARARMEEKPVTPETQIKEWIAQLGNEDFEVRERAEAHLRKAGHAAMSLLRQAQETQDQDLEVKTRLGRLCDGLWVWDGRESVSSYALTVGLKATEALALGQALRLDLVLIPPGRFTMGNPQTEEDLERNEGPPHEVTLSKPFYMGKCEITQEQYEAVMGKNPSTFKGARNPVENVSWKNAGEFCRKLSARTGKTVRLPTEAEWEYACRAGTKTRFCSGDAEDDLGHVGWYAKNSGKTTHPVGQKKPNAWGLYDMHGNVWEWCQDWYAQKYEPEPAADPQAAAEGSCRVFRGGSWGEEPAGCRSAIRWRGYPDYSGNIVGFRVVVDAPANP